MLNFVRLVRSKRDVLLSPPSLPVAAGGVAAVPVGPGRVCNCFDLVAHGPQSVLKPRIHLLHGGGKDHLDLFERRHLFVEGF
jgi:hypothetical protein